MKYWMAFIFGLVTIGLTGTARAADNPAGTWKWTSMDNGHSRETKVKLKYEGGKLSGAMPGPKGTETPFENATFKDGEISFSFKRANGIKLQTKTYTGKLSGDTIKGTIETERDGKTTTQDWEAKRS